MSNQVDHDIAKLQDLGTVALRELWSKAFGLAVPRRISRDLLLRTLTHDLQERAEGGLSKAARKLLGKLADSKCRAARAMPSTPRLKSGTHLVRQWRGEVYQVTVLDDGFEYRGTIYASLSRIAREITGARWSGPLFFGLRKTGNRKEISSDAG